MASTGMFLPTSNVQLLSLKKVLNVASLKSRAQLYSPFEAGPYIPKDIGRNQCHLMGNVVFELTQGL